MQYFVKVSDGVIAPQYESEALEILKKKKAGKYCIIQVRYFLVIQGFSKVT